MFVPPTSATSTTLLCLLPDVPSILPDFLHGMFSDLNIAGVKLLAPVLAFIGPFPFKVGKAAIVAKVVIFAFDFFSFDHGKYRYFFFLLFAGFEDPPVGDPTAFIIASGS